MHPNITLNEVSRDTSLFLVLTALKRPLHAICLKKKQASHQNANIIFLASVFLILRYKWDVFITECWKYCWNGNNLFCYIVVFKRKYMKIVNWKKHHKNLIKYKCDRLPICHNYLEWTINMAVRWGNILSYPLNNEKYVVLYGICIHLHYTLDFSLLPLLKPKVTISRSLPKI